jgi:hypothetical protein
MTLGMPCENLLKASKSDIISSTERLFSICRALGRHTLRKGEIPVVCSAVIPMSGMLFERSLSYAVIGEQGKKSLYCATFSYYPRFQENAVTLRIS